MSQIHPMFQKYASGSSAATAARNQKATSANKVSSADFLTEFDAALSDGEQQAKGDAKAKRAAKQSAMQGVFSTLDICVDQYGMARIVEGAEAVPLESTRGMDLVRLKVHSTTGEATGDETLKREISLVRAKATATGNRRNVFKRIAPGPNGGVIIDCGGNREIVVSAGCWSEQTSDGNTLFSRGPGFGELPSPVRHDGPQSALKAICQILGEMGVPEIRRLVLVVALVNALRHGVPYVVILLLGGAGSGKTTAAGHLGGFIDPTTSGELPNVPLNSQDIAAVGAEQHVIGSDNLSRIEPDASDLVCVVANGTEFVLRQFHTRAETTRMAVHCQIIMTAITNPVNRGDLIDRLLPIQLEPHDNYLGEDEVRQWFKQAHPVAFGALLELLAAGLALLPSVKGQRRWTHRLVDVMQLGEAIVQACGMGVGVFVEDFKALRESSAHEAASGDPVLQTVLDVVRDIASKGNESEKFRPWRMWSTAGHDAIKHGGKVEVAIKASTLRTLVRNKAMGSSPRWLPETDKQMADVITQKKPVLAAIGIEVSRQCFNGDSGAAWVFSWSE